MPVGPRSFTAERAFELILARSDTFRGLCKKQRHLWPLQRKWKRCDVELEVGRFAFPQADGLCLA